MSTYKNTLSKKLCSTDLLGSYKNIYSSETNKFAWGIRYSNSNACFLKCFSDLVFLATYIIYVHGMRIGLYHK